MSEARSAPVLRTGEPAVDRRAWWAAVVVFALTVGQLAVATYVPGLPQFEGKAFGARLLFYPMLMAVVPVGCWLLRRHRGGVKPLPWAACAFVMAPFLVDVSGNTFNLYDTVDHWDDVNHFGNWLLLCTGLGLLVAASYDARRWLLVVSVTGIGAMLAIAWELGEWYTFIRHGTELDTAYEDTLGDETLGTLGAFMASLLVAWLAGRDSVLLPARGRRCEAISATPSRTPTTRRRADPTKGEPPCRI